MPPAIECGNPLLLKWLEEWVVEAQERGYKSLPTVKKARDSMKACPMRFDHPSEAVCLNGLGEGLAKRLTDSLEKYCDEVGIPMPKKPRGKKRKSVAVDDGGESVTPSPSPKKARKPKPYVPKLRSGAYAIMLALGTQPRNSRIGITKEEIIALAQPFCDTSFTQTRPSEFFTAWNSMKTLINKDFVYTKKNPASRYYLTDEGWDLADTIKASGDPTLGRAHDFQPVVAGPSKTASRNQDNDSDSELEEINSPSRPSSQSNPNILDIPNGETTSIPTFEPIILRPGTFTVELILDNREVASKKDRDGIPNQLASMGVPHSVRALPLGDFLWVARVREDKAKWLNLGASNLIMLDYIMERKRLDDLIGSIKDGRYEEQKFRLKRSSITNVKYLVEHKKIDADILDKWGDGITTSIAKMIVQDGIHVKQTLDLNESLNYIERMTKLLKKQYEENPIYIIPTKVLSVKNYTPLMQHLRKTEPNREYNITFDAFDALSSKSQNLTLKDIFLKMLMRTRGITASKAIEIQKRWATPRAFLEAFENLDTDEGHEAPVSDASKSKTKGKGKGPVLLLDPEEASKKRKREMVSNEIGALEGNKKVQGALSARIAEVWGDVV
ncbi:hypothetical protein BOTNAR_0123g00020 [Botryotinia narcissicola]|uniref:Crossover junction endonuclease MUS81 n=1 Tax=Botryotinia narcissicola TaxID=278944 RepID=A0A4Z1IYU8_9HELO|nr:hypothetical protein BOTNAR_0123g00020 [Botryotinia narcissicola]